MNTGGFLNWLVFSLARWLLALRGRRLELEAVPLPSYLTQPRDSRGRFTSPHDPPVPSRVGEGEGPSSARPGETQWSTETLLEEAGLTPRMIRKAAVPFEPPDDFENIPALQIQLRKYILSNLDTWINGRVCGVWTAFHVLQQTWAIDRLRYAVHAARVKAGAAALPMGYVGAQPAAPAVWTGPALSAEGQSANAGLPSERRYEQPQPTYPELRDLGASVVNQTVAGAAGCAPTADAAGRVPTEVFSPSAVSHWCGPPSAGGSADRRPGTG